MKPLKAKGFGFFFIVMVLSITLEITAPHSETTPLDL
jgi:hypothetical protein